jgi:hypothetical protein
MSLYQIEADQISFPLDYRLFRPVHSGIDAVYPGNPVCPFCERPFQCTRQDIRWDRIGMVPLMLSGLREIGPEDVMTNEKDDDTVEPVAVAVVGRRRWRR